MNRLLLCPPDFYTVRYEINPWMDRTKGVDSSLARDQWSQLCGTLKGLGCELNLVPAEQDWPDMVFTANAGLTEGRRVLLSNFRHAERAGEQRGFEQWFQAHDYEVTRLPPELAFEGEGDALWFGHTLCFGHGFRTDAEAHHTVADWCGGEALSLLLVEPRYYHLDTCFCPLNASSALWHPEAFDAAGREALRRLVPDLIEVSSEEAACFACNSIVLEREVVLPEGCPLTTTALRSRGFNVHAVPMSEFIKAGGACKCLVLHLR
jgi:N-dimethylarginine dimethylaminohydrolase